MDMKSYIINFSVAGTFAVVMYFIAKKRGNHKALWAFSGFLIGPIAIPFIFFTKNHNKSSKKVTSSEPELSTTQGHDILNKTHS